MLFKNRRYSNISDCLLMFGLLSACLLLGFLTDNTHSFQGELQLYVESNLIISIKFEIPELNWNM